jgi:hypothetical protein
MKQLSLLFVTCERYEDTRLWSASNSFAAVACNVARRMPCPANSILRDLYPCCHVTDMKPKRFADAFEREGYFANGLGVKCLISEKKVYRHIQ